MGVYSITESAVTSTTVDWEAVEEFAGTPDFNGACELVAESEMNYNRFMQAVGINELNYMETNGEEIVYEGAKLKGYVEKAKKFFQNILEKIKGFIKKFMVNVDSLIKSNDGFVKKYEEELSKMSTSVKINGYVFTNLTEKEYSVKIRDGQDFYSTEEIQSNVLGGKVDGNFSEAIFKHYHNGETSKKDITVSDIKGQLSVIKSTKDLKDKAKKSYKAAEKQIKTILKELDNAAKAINKGETATEDSNAAMLKLNKSVKAYKDCASAMHMVQGGYLAALKAQNSQAKAVCVKALQGKYAEETKKNIKEGFTHYEEDFLSEVEFV